jgi:hypothetical protein
MTLPNFATTGIQLSIIEIVLWCSTTVKSPSVTSNAHDVSASETILPSSRDLVDPVASPYKSYRSICFVECLI